MRREFNFDNEIEIMNLTYNMNQFNQKQNVNEDYLYSLKNNKIFRNENNL